MTKWNNDLCTTFMELYQTEPIIWNPKDPCYKDRNKVLDAWERISKALNIPIDELKTKKMSLMATFRGHLRKKKASIKRGARTSDIYKPIWFLYDMMESFLGNINEYQTINTERQGNNFQAVEIDEESSMIEITPMPQSPIASTSQQSFPPQHQRRRAKRANEQKIEYRINEGCKQMKDTIDTSNQRTEEDECDLYCKLLAKKLRRLPENERSIFMYEIDGLFINRLRNVSSPSSNVYESHYVPQRPTSAQSFYSETEMKILKRSNSSSPE